MSTQNFEKNLGNYRKIAKLGQGSYGIVYKALDKVNDKIVILKKIISIKNEDFEQEVKILKHIYPKCKKYLNCIQGYVNYRDSKYIIMDYLEGYTTFLERKPSNFEMLLQLMLKMGEGLINLHSLDVAHLDISEGNVMWNDDLDIHFIDYGASVIHTDKNKMIDWIKYRMFPTKPKDKDFNKYYFEIAKKVDIWFLGNLFLKLATNLTFEELITYELKLKDKLREVYIELAGYDEVNIDYEYYVFKKDLLIPYIEKLTDEDISKYVMDALDGKFSELPFTYEEYEKILLYKIITPMLSVNWRKRPSADKIFA